MKADNFSNKRKFGFTLAEVLITLGIIGVVAAITLPVISANINKQRTITQLKKAYSVMSQAVKLSEIDNNETAGWDYELKAKPFYEKYLKGYLKNVKELNYASLSSSIKYISMNNANCNETWCASGSSYYFMLADGSIIGVSDYIGHTYKAFTVDVNGLKGPNKTGIDYFIYTIQANGVRPYGVEYSVLGFKNKLTYSEMTGSGRGCSPSGTGVFCSALILNDGWKINYKFK